MSLTGKSPAETYKDITYVDNDNNGVSSSLSVVRTGEGSSTSLSVSDRSLKVKSATNNTVALDVQNSSGTSKLFVDTTNGIVKTLGTHTNTQFATFSIVSIESTGFVDDTHMPLTYSSANYSTATYIPTFGTSTDPATTFTTSETNRERAASLVPCLWYLPANISIDSVHSIEGADAATGDTTRMHLFSYDFTSGATACLTNGTLLAHNSDVTNAGSEQPYLSTWTVDSATVASGKVILAFFRSDSINSDYSIQVTVKYHLT